jgi:glucose/mannose-6-phosphate isomerase
MTSRYTLMLKLSTLQKYDKKSMHKIYDEWPEISQKSYTFNHKVINLKKINHIVFAGMGGSGTIGDIFSSIFSCTNIHVDVVKGYKLPKTISKNTLVVTTSVSGNTAETISILKNVIKNKVRSISFSSGGKIINICKKNHIDYRIIPKYLNPRSSLVAYLYSMLKVLKPILPITEIEINDSIKKLYETKKQISSKNLSMNNPSLVLAKSLSIIPLIYYPFGLESAAIRFKNSLEENSKMHVITEDVIEACHNGIVSWEKISKIEPILIQGKDDNIMTKKYQKILKKFFKIKHVDYLEINSLDGNILTKIINLIYLFDYASIYRATLTKTDPYPVKSIDYIKNNLNKKII